MSVTAERDPRVMAAVATAAEELASVLLPRLVDGLARSARELGVLAHGARDVVSLREAELGELERSAVECAESGWCAGVLSAAVDADLLVARRDPAGLRVFVRRLASALGRELSPGPERLPDVGLARGRGWEVPLLAGWLLLGSARAKSSSGALRWSVERAGERTRWAVEHTPDPARTAALAGLVPGARPGRSSHGWYGLELPAGWLLDTARLECAEG